MYMHLLSFLYNYFMSVETAKGPKDQPKQLYLTMCSIFLMMRNCEMKRVCLNRECKSKWITGCARTLASKIWVKDNDFMEDNGFTSNPFSLHSVFHLL